MPTICDVFKIPTILTLVKRIQDKMTEETNNVMNLGEISEEYFFRGEDKKWGCFRGEDKKCYSFSSSSLWRVMSEEDQESSEAYKRKILVLIDSVKRKSSTNDDLIHTMVKLRHDGIETPLIDLSTNFYIALFFASLPTQNDVDKGRVMVFKKSNFTNCNYIDFSQHNLLSFWTSIKEINKPVILKGIEWMHPNIRKQKATLCFSSDGKIKADSFIEITPEEKSKAIDELKALNISIEDLFTGWEGISTSLRLDKKPKKLAIKSKDDILKVFANCIDNYNKGIIKLINSLEPFETKVLFLKDSFRDIYLLEEIPLPIWDVLFFLEQEIYIQKNSPENQIRPLPKKVVQKANSIPTNKLRDYWGEVMSKTLELERILLIDTNLHALSKYLSLTLKHEYWFTYDVSQKPKEIKNLGKIKKVFKTIVKNWLKYIHPNNYKKSNFDLVKKFEEEPPILLKHVCRVFCEVKNVNYRNDEHSNACVKEEAKKVFEKFSKQVIATLLLLCLNPKNLSSITPESIEDFFKEVEGVFNNTDINKFTNPDAVYWNIEKLYKKVESDNHHFYHDESPSENPNEKKLVEEKNVKNILDLILNWGLLKPSKATP